MPLLPRCFSARTRWKPSRSAGARFQSFHLTMMLLAVVFISTGHTGAAQGTPVNYAVIDLGDIVPTAINNNGTIVGYRRSTGLACVWENGTVKSLPVPVGTGSAYATDINDRGEVVGWYGAIPSPLPSGNQVPFKWEKGDFSVTIIGDSHARILLGEKSVRINNSGVVIANFNHDFFTSGAYLKDGAWVSLSMSSVIGVNNSGLIVGVGRSGGLATFDVSSGIFMSPQSFVGLSGTTDINDFNQFVGGRGIGNEGFLANTEGQVESIGNLGISSGRVFSQAKSINNYGEVVGISSNSTRFSNAILYSNYNLNDLNTLIPQDGTILEVAEDINDRGEIIGTGTRNGHDFSFLLSRDTDGDGMPDEWEKNGYSSNGHHVDLRGMGARWDHKDIFVYFDYLIQPECTSTTDKHTHEILPGAINDLKHAFSDAPVTNPDGVSGITLHIIKGSAILETIGNIELGEMDSEGKYNWQEFSYIKGVSMPKELIPVCHYCLMGHFGSKTADGHPESGISRGVPASDFLVTLGARPGQTGTSREQAGTFMHELGHNLGLSHGGSSYPEQGNKNHKPNYISVMNYLYQFTGIIRRTEGSSKSQYILDYSRFTLPPLNEGLLDETIGLGDSLKLAGYGCVWKTNRTNITLLDASGAIDWNQDYLYQHALSFDVNQDHAIERLDGGSTDWQMLKFRGGTLGFSINGEVQEPSLPMQTKSEEATNEDAAAVKPLPPTGITARAGRGSVRLAWDTTSDLPDTRYRVYRSINGSTFSVVATSAAPLYSDEGLIAGREAKYFVTGVSPDAVESDPSTIVTIVVR